jgi:hypothetical protein
MYSYSLDLLRRYARDEAKQRRAKLLGASVVLPGHEEWQTVSPHLSVSVLMPDGKDQTINVAI